MLLIYLKACVLLIGLAAGWWSVERLWSRSVGADLPADTGGCGGGCGCTRRRCENKDTAPELGPAPRG